MKTYSTKDDLDRVIGGLRGKGVCYICRDLETGEVFGDQPTVYDDDRLRAVLTLFPRMKATPSSSSSPTARTSRR